MLPLKHYGIILTIIFTVISSQESFADNIVTDVYDKSKKAIEEYRVKLHSWDSLIRGYRRGHNYSLSACSLNTTWKSSIFDEDLDTMDSYNITLEVLEYGVFTDFFVSMHTGLRFFYKEKIRSNSSSFKMVGNSSSFGLGIVYHVL